MNETKQEMKARDVTTPRVKIGIMVVLLIVLGYLLISIRNSPGFRMRRELALGVQCCSNLSELWKAMRVYSEEFDQYPAPEKWCDLLMEQCGEGLPVEIFRCPAFKTGRSHYAMNPKALPDSPGYVVLLFETKNGWYQHGGKELMYFDNHGSSCTVMLNRHHIELVGTDEVDQLVWDAEDVQVKHPGNHRLAKNDDDLRYWLKNMIWHHRFSDEEISLSIGLTSRGVKAAKNMFYLDYASGPKWATDASLLVLPYPGGRHPRIGFLEGAVDPQRETKSSVFTPWDANSYVVVDVPEAIWSNLGLTYLAHTHIDTIWTKQGITLERLEWNRRPDGGLDIRRKLPNGIEFAVAVTPTRDAVLMEMRLANGTREKLTDLRVQNCVMTKMAKGFEQQTSENKVLKDPYAACRSGDGKRWIITAWQGCHRTWANEKCPCFHSDPKFPDLEPGREATLKSWLSFYEGTDIEGEFKRIEATGWREKQP